MEETVFTPALEGISNIKSEQGKMQIKPFLDVCKLLLSILDKFGAAMTAVKSDISGNISAGIKIYFQSNQIQLLVQLCTGRSLDKNYKVIVKLHKRSSLVDEVPIKLAPDRKKFMEVIGGSADNYEEMDQFCENFSPYLLQIHKFLTKCGLDNMKAS